MPRPSKGIYVRGNAIVRFGYQDRPARAGEEFHVVTDTSARALLRDAATTLVNLAWDGMMVVRRRQVEIDARLRVEALAADDARFEQEQDKAVLSLLLDEINILRVRAGLVARTIEQAKSKYEAKLNR